MGFQSLGTLLLAAGVFVLAPGSVSGSDAAEDAKAIVSAASSANWDDAARRARQFEDPVAVDLVTWWRLRDGEGDWQEYLDFLRRNGDWPGLKRLRRSGEAGIPDTAAPRAVVAYFEAQPPQTGEGALRLATALAALGRRDDAAMEAAKAWIEFPMETEDEAELLARFPGVLGVLHEKRLDSLLWSGEIGNAERMLTRVSPRFAKLARARIALQRRTPGVDALIRAIPADLRNDPGLAYDRFVWRRLQGLDESALELILDRSASADRLGRPGTWAPTRMAMARDAMERGENRNAYALASSHWLEWGSRFAQFEWLAGFIALRKLDRPERAIAHFGRFREAVSSPISLGRANYWLARGHARIGDDVEAELFFSEAAKYQTSFYGQLAAEMIGHRTDGLLAGKERAGDWRRADFVDSGTVRAARLFLLANWQPHARWFLAHVAEDLGHRELVRLGDMALDLGSPYAAIGVAKEAAKSGLVLPRSYFPVTELARHAGPVEPEMALAIARQETEFRIDAASRAGALGLMQVKPPTAREIAARLGLEYSKRRLAYDWRFNAAIGTAYLDELLNEFGGSYVLAFAAYNAGPGRVRQWIDRLGHPHLDWSDPIDWIEHIPYNETRNYVMRVLEAIYVYRARLAGRAQAFETAGNVSRWQPPPVH